MDFLLAFSVVVIVLGLFLMARNQAVYRVRMALIDWDDFPSSYQRLPSYDAMVMKPRFWLLWTEGQWSRYITKEQA